jgi:hypothetical protein
MKPCLYLKASPQTDMTHRDSPINTLEMDIKMTIQRQSDFKILQNELLAALPMLLSANELCWALVRSTLTYIKKRGIVINGYSLIHFWDSITIYSSKKSKSNA